MHTKTLTHIVVDAEVAELASRFGHDPEAVVELLRALQAKRGRLTSETIQQVAKVLRLPASRVYGLATFYSMLTSDAPQVRTIRICDGPYCMLRGAGDLICRMQAKLGASWTITRTSCLGLCDRAPAALVRDEQVGPVPLERFEEVTIGWCGEVSDYRKPRPGETRVLLPDSLAEDYDPHDALRHDGDFPALRKALSGSRQAVLDELDASQLRGRGGAGFPSGRKWRFVAQETRSPKYVVCNADESEPLSFKDRVLLDLQAWVVLEGMAIVAYAVGAEEGFVYIRGEYASQVQRLQSAIEAALDRGLLGTRIMGSDFSLRIRVHRGAGAYVCGEETALLESLEGRRGEPRSRPPFPTTHGYARHPTDPRAGE